MWLSYSPFIHLCKYIMMDSPFQWKHMSTLSHLQHQHFKFQPQQLKCTGCLQRQDSIHTCCESKTNHNALTAVPEWSEEEEAWPRPTADGSRLRCVALNSSLNPTCGTFEEAPATIQVGAWWEAVRVKVPPRPSNSPPTHPYLARCMIDFCLLAVQQIEKDADNWWRPCLLRARRIAVSVEVGGVR